MAGADAPERPTAYEDAHAHLRDELRRVWLRVELQIRRRWEQGVLPLVLDDTSVGAWSPGSVAGLFAAANAEYLGRPLGAECAAVGAERVLDEFLRHSAWVEARIAASEAAGLRLPLCDIGDRFSLTVRQRAALTFALMPEIDFNLITAYRYLVNDPGCCGLDPRLLSLLVYDTPAARASLARDLSPRSPLLFYRLLEVDEGDGPAPTMFRRLRPAGRLVQRVAGDGDELDAALREAAELRRRCGRAAVHDVPARALLLRPATHAVPPVGPHAAR